MAAVDTSVQQNLKFKITSKGLRLNSGEKTAEKAMKLIVRSGISAKPSMPSNSTSKQSAETSLAGQKAKIQKIDRTLKLHCSNILKELMNDRRGWCPSGALFNQPVDPVKLMIPDYFSIITNPMDLGTIKNKLERNLYFSAEEFSADVRLTFLNAMLYNPPVHNVHKVAKILIGHFNTKWKSLEAKLKREKAAAVNEFSSDSQKTVEKSCKPSSLERRPMLSVPCEKKLKLGKNLTCADPVKVVLKESRLLGNTLQKANHRQTDTRARCSSCGDLICHCRDKSAPAKAYSSDISTERSSEHDHCGDSKLDFEAKYPSTINASRSGPDSDGESSLISSIPLSPKMALRAAMLKSRFAGTIYKATHQGEKTDPLRMQQERARLERQQLEEKARIEKEIKAAEEAIRLKTQAELKIQREKEREAARIAVLKMERTVEIDVNLGILKDLEMFCCSPYSSPEAVENPLKRLGLFFKEVSGDCTEEDEAVLMGEEGEIFEECCL